MAVITVPRTPVAARCYVAEYCDVAGLRESGE